jgi:hypothetical protein
VTRRTIRGAFAVPARSRAAPRIAVLALSVLAGRAFAATVVVESGRFGNTFVAGEVPALSVRVAADADRPVRGTLRVRPDAIALRTLSDLVGSATPTAGGPVGRGFSAYDFAAWGGNVTALVDGNDPGLTWMPESASILRVAVPAGVRRVETIDLMGNRRLRRVRGGRLRVAMLGVATFLRADGGAPLTGLRVIGSRARPG